MIKANDTSRPHDAGEPGASLDTKYANDERAEVFDRASPIPEVADIIHHEIEVTTTAVERPERLDPRKLFFAYAEDPASGYKKEEITKIDSVTLAIVRPEILGAVESWTEEVFHEEYWDEENFEKVHLSWHGKDFWVGPVIHIKISDTPSLVATCFTQKVKKIDADDPFKNSMYFIICSKPIEKTDLVERYDESMDEEQISFMVEFDYDGPGRHSLKHRYVSPKFEGNGLGSEILKRYESLFQKMADNNEKKLTQSNIIDTNKLDTMIWVARNHYVPDTYEDRQRWEEVKQRKTRDGEPIIMGVERNLVTAPENSEVAPRRIYVKFRKDFPANHTKAKVA